MALHVLNPSRFMPAMIPKNPSMNITAITAMYCSILFVVTSSIYDNTYAVDADIAAINQESFALNIILILRNVNY